MAAALLTSACQMNADEPGNAPIVTPTAAVPPTTETSFASQTVRAFISGVEIGVSLPEDWQVDEYHGLLMVEHAGKHDGMSIYLFVPQMDDFQLNEAELEDNVALAALREVVQMPSAIGTNVSISEPQHFQWDDCEAAYYLLSSDDGTRSLVMAIEVTDENRLVVLNITMPEDQASLIREKLPLLLDGLTINGDHLTGIALEELPDPLPFPEYQPVQTEAAYSSEN